jgi:hypothetical protein
MVWTSRKDYGIMEWEPLALRLRERPKIKWGVM